MIEPFDLNLRHMRAIPEIVARGSVAAAAAATSLSQPALTQGLAKIERQLGVPLFERRPGGMAATEIGAAFAQRIVAAFDQLAAAGRGMARGRRGFARPHRLMTSNQLRAFLGVADAGGFAEAARATGGSQPAIHRAVRDLEQLAGIALFERRGRGVVPTAAGRALARATRLAGAEIAAGIAGASPEVSARGRLVIGALPLSRARLLPAAIATMLRDLPDVTIDVIEGSWRELAEPLRDGVIDLMVGALREAPAPRDLAQEPLLEDRLLVVARAGHPLCTMRGPADLDALARYPWIVGRADAPLRGHWEALFAGRALPPAPVECGSVMTIRGILIDSDCLTLLSRDQVAMEVESGVLALIAPPGRITRTIGITTRAGWRPTPFQARFADALRHAARHHQIA